MLQKLVLPMPASCAQNTKLIKPFTYSATHVQGHILLNHLIKALWARLFSGTSMACSQQAKAKIGHRSMAFCQLC